MKRLIRRDIRRSNTRDIEKVIARNKQSNIFAKRRTLLSPDKAQELTGTTVTSKPEIRVHAEVENLYATYTAPPPTVSGANDLQAKLTCHYTKDLPNIDLYEIRIASRQLRNTKAQENDGITAALSRAGGTPVSTQLIKILYSVIHTGI